MTLPPVSFPSFPLLATVIIILLSFPGDRPLIRVDELSDPSKKYKNNADGLEDIPKTDTNILAASVFIPAFQKLKTC